MQAGLNWCSGRTRTSEGMNEKNDFALVPRLPSAVEKAEPGAKRVLSGMVADTLAIALKERTALPTDRFRIGDTEWRGPDYQQLLTWARDLRMQPERVVQLLLDEENLRVDETGQLLLFPIWEGPVCADGRLLLITWDLVRLPLSKFEWNDGLEVTRLRFLYPREDTAVDVGRLPLRRLMHLSCPRLGLQGLDLSELNQLEFLDCGSNAIQALDLLGTPKLKVLRCAGNELAELDLVHTPNLESLSCGGNGISRPVLSGTPQLQFLECGNNGINELNLSSVPKLRCLVCSDNDLGELTLQSVPDLVRLDCSRNKLT